MFKKLCIVFLLFLILSAPVIFAKGSSEKEESGMTVIPFDDLKFALLTDLHLILPEQKGNSDGYRLGLKTTEILENTVRDLNKMPDLDFVLVAGDLTVDAEPWNIDAVKMTLNNLDVPYYVILGNHDSSPIPHNDKEVRVGMSKYAIANVFAGKRGGMDVGCTYYSKELAENLQLVALDSTTAQKYDEEAGMGNFRGNIDPAQMKWLEKTLKANKEKTIIVMQHHGTVAFADGDNTNHNYWSWFKLENGKDVQALYKKYGVKAVLSGHHHISTRVKTVDGVNHFTNAALSSFPMSYTLYNITPKGMSYEVIAAPVPAEYHALVKKNFLANKWWRDADHTMTPEGDAKYVEFYDSPETKKGSVKF